MKKGFSYLEVLISMALWALISLFFLQVALTSVVRMQRATENWNFREAAKRSKIEERGKFKGVEWRLDGDLLIIEKGKRRLKLRRVKNEEIRIFPR